MIFGLLRLFYGEPTRRLKPLSERIGEGTIKCSLCRGYGATDVGAGLPLSCHRCVNGVTTTRFERAAQAWEYFCYPSYRSEPLRGEALATYVAKQNSLLEEYSAAKAERDELSERYR